MFLFCSDLKTVIISLATLMSILGVFCDEIGESAIDNNSIRMAEQTITAGEEQEEDKEGRHVPPAEGDDAKVDENGRKYCGIHSNGFEPLHALMDQICELCHDFFSHYRPNTRVECRSDCFRTVTFKKCLRLFKPNRARRQLMGFLMVEK